MSLKIEFGRMVRTNRKLLKMRQMELSKLADMDLRHIYNIERGLKEPKLRTVIVLADILKLDLNALKAFAGHDENGIYWKFYDTLEEAGQGECHD